MICKLGSRSSPPGLWPRGSCKVIMHLNGGTSDALYSLAPGTISLTAAFLCAVVLVGPNVKTMDVAQANSSLVTVIYKNQLYPSVGELGAQGALTEHKGEANIPEGLAFRGRGQWI